MKDLDHICERRTVKGKGYLYDVYYKGERIVKNCRDPFHQACRVLKRRGMTGSMGFFITGGAQISMVTRDLVYCAHRRVLEGNWVGPVITEWHPYKGDENED